MPLYLKAGALSVKDDSGVYHSMNVLTDQNKEALKEEIKESVIESAQEQLVTSATVEIEQAVQDIIDDIPSDYTELSDDVRSIKSIMPSLIEEGESGLILNIAECEVLL